MKLTPTHRISFSLFEKNRGQHTNKLSPIALAIPAILGLGYLYARSTGGHKEVTEDKEPTEASIGRSLTSEMSNEEAIKRIFAGEPYVGKIELSGYTFQGEFLNHSLTHGSVKRPDGALLEGKFSNWKLTEGKKTFPEGEFQKGSFDSNETLLNGSFTGLYGITIHYSQGIPLEPVLGTIFGVGALFVSTLFLTGRKS